MSLRDFNSSSDDRPVILNTDPVGNTGGLGGFHTTNPEDREPNNIPKIVGGLVVALMLGGAGAYIYSVSGSAPAKQQVIASNQQLPPAPAPQAAPPAPMPASDSNTTATAPTPAADVAPAPNSTPVRSASVSKTRTATAKTPDTSTAQADSTPAVQLQQQAAAVPDAVSPQVPASALASTGQPANPEVAPQPDTAAPAQDQQPVATPAPAAEPAPQPQQ